MQHLKYQKQVQCIKRLKMVIEEYEMKHLNQLLQLEFGQIGPWMTNIRGFQLSKAS